MRKRKPHVFDTRAVCYQRKYEFRNLVYVMRGATKHLSNIQNRNDTRCSYCFLDFSVLFVRNGRDCESDAKETYADVCCRSFLVRYLMYSFPKCTEESFPSFVTDSIFTFQQKNTTDLQVNSCYTHERGDTQISRDD